MEWVFENWYWIVIAFGVLEKVVKLTPTKYDDIILDMILKPIFAKFKNLKNNK